MRIATWNVNSIRTRKSLVIDFLHHHDVDVLAMQETKCRDDQFPFEEFSEAGYEVAHFGLNQWNGVGIASRLPLHDIEQGFAGMPGFSKTNEDPAPLEARALSATVDLLRISPLAPHVAGSLRTTETDSIGITTKEMNCQTSSPQAVTKFSLCPSARSVNAVFTPCTIARSPPSCLPPASLLPGAGG